MFGSGAVVGGRDGENQKSLADGFWQIELREIIVALFFHSDEVDEFIPFREAVAIAENALRDLNTPFGVNAPRKRLNLHRNLAEGSFDTVLNIYAGGSAAYGAVGAQVALHRKAIAGNTQRRPPYNPDQTELALIYDTDSGSLLGVMAHRPRHVAKEVDIILCMTNSNVPVIDGSWLEEGQYIISVIGSNIELVKSGNIAAPRREIDDETLKRCSFIVALSKEQAIDSQQGDIYWPVQKGIIGWDRVVDISDVLAARVKGRTDDKQIILYKNQGGQGIVDIALAKKCYDLAKQHGKGYELRIEARENWWVQGGRTQTW
jgi:hypothetical protein